MGDYIDIKAIATPMLPGPAFLLSWGDFAESSSRTETRDRIKEVVFAIDR